MAAPVLLVALGTLAVLRTLAPASAWLGPVLVILAGLVWLALRTDLVSSLPRQRLFAAGLLIVGSALAIVPTRPSHGIRALFARATAFVFPRSALVRLPLRRLAARAVLAQLTVDLTPDSAGVSDGEGLSIDVQVFGGRVVVIVPSAWQVAPGRLHATRGVTFAGLVDGQPAQGGPTNAPASETVTVNAIGVAGSVALVRAG